MTETLPTQNEAGPGVSSMNAFSCPTCGGAIPAYAAVNDAILAITGELSLEPVLEKIVYAARELVHARYAALGVPDEMGGFDRFITSGMTSQQWEAIGPLPRTHGLLGAMLLDPAPFRTPDIEVDSRFQGWPDHHPRMRSFMGIPIVARGEIVGAFYLTDKLHADHFSESDQQLIEMLAAHAAIAMENANLYERSRELSVIEERNRLARDLHDSVAQILFGIDLTAEAAASLVDRDPGEAKERIHELQRLGRDATRTLRTLIFELRPADEGGGGLAADLEMYVDGLRRVYPVAIDVRVEGEHRLKPSVERQIFGIAQEALNNALKHSGATQVDVKLDFCDENIALAVSDNGSGFDPLLRYDPLSARSKRLGLTSMQERADELGGRLRIESAPGAGTTVKLEMHIG